MENEPLWLEFATAGYAPYFIAVALIAVFGFVSAVALHWFWNREHRSDSPAGALGKFARVNRWEPLAKDDPRRRQRPPLSLFETRDPVSIEDLLFKHEGSVDAYLFGFARRSAGRELSTTVIAFDFGADVDVDALRLTPDDEGDFPYAIEGELGSDARARFSRKRGWNVEATGSWIAFWRPLQSALATQGEVRRNPLDEIVPEGGRIPVRELPRFVDEAWELLGTLQRAGAHAPTLDPDHA